MATFLFVLKITGTVLLVLLLFVLIFLLLLLFFPVGYRIDLSADSDRERYEGRAGIYWLFHFINAKAWYKKHKGLKEDEKNPGFEVRVMFFKVFPRREKEEEDYYSGTGADLYTDLEEPAVVISEPAGEASAETPTETAKDQIPADSESKETDTTGSYYENDAGGSSDTGYYYEEESEDEGIPKGLKSKIKEFTGFLRGTAKKIQGAKSYTSYKNKEICDKINKLYRKVRHLKETCDDERFDKAFSLAVSETLRILKAIRPRSIKADLLFGADDPALTGEAAGIASVLLMGYEKNLILTPEFDRKVIKGEGVIRGHLMMITVLIVLWKLYFNRDIRWVLRRIKRD